MLSVAARRAFASRSFATSTRLAKGPVESAKDAIKKVDRTVSDAAVKGIDKGEQMANSIKGSASSNAGSAQGTAKEALGEAKGKASELEGKAKGKAEEIKGKM